MTQGILLSTTNLMLPASQWILPGATNAKQTTMELMPFGDTGGDGSGQIGLKVILIGSVPGSGAVGVEGIQTDQALLTDTKVLPVGGQARAGTYNPASSIGTAVLFSVDVNTGRLMVDALESANHGLGTQVTSTAASATLVAARFNRRRVTVLNTDAANAIWINTSAATTAAGFKLAAGQSKDFTTQEALNVIDNGSHAVLCVWEEWG